MEKYSKPSKDRFQLALLRSLLFGVLTNVYITGIILYAGLPMVLISPFIGTVIFLLAYQGLKRGKVSTKTAFLFAAYTVVAEVIVHTFIFGWSVGFYFYLFLLPLVFLLEYNWKRWFAIFFNVTVFAALLLLVYFFKGASHYKCFSSFEIAVLAYMNGTFTIIIAVSIIIHSSLVLNQRDELLLDIIDDLETKNRQIEKQSDHQKILLKEIHHRVKNNLQIISSLLSLQSRNLEDEQLLGVLNESRSRVEAIALIHKKLYQDELGGNSVDFKAYLEDFIEKQRVLNPRIEFNLNAEELILHLDIAVPLGLIVSELITNAVKHAFERVQVPEVTIELVRLGDQFELWVRDNGIGLSDDFDFNSGDLGLGADIIVALTDQIDAQMSFFNKNGASFKISFENKALD